MSDFSVSEALRSKKKLVVVEAPAGCGKTHQGSTYAGDAASCIGGGRVLILTHTHAACNVFALRTQEASRRIEIRTIDSLICEIATAYHVPLGLPSNPSAWARMEKGRFEVLATKVARLLHAAPVVADSLVQRHPIIICDEHQDANDDQESVVFALHKSGAFVRIFGDPMQRIFGSQKHDEVTRDKQRWLRLQENADHCDSLDHPHRWSNGSAKLGEWVLAARELLQNNKQIDLRNNMPTEVEVIEAENQLPYHGRYKLDKASRRPLDSLVNKANSILILAAHNDTVHTLRSFFSRSLPIWEGHVRDNLSGLVAMLQSQKDDTVAIAKGLIEFIQAVTTGFSNSSFGDNLLEDVSNGCTKPRKQRPAKIKELAQLLVDSPNHKGISRVLRRIHEFSKSEAAFRDIKVDFSHEYWDAVHLEAFDDPVAGLAELSRRRSYTHSMPPRRAISTVHKAKGLERENVIIMPCDAKHFPDSDAARCRLYVAMSRAIRSLTFVVSKNDPSPLMLR